MKIYVFVFGPLDLYICFSIHVKRKVSISAMNDESSGNVTQEEICNELPNCATSVCDSSDLCGIGEETQQA